MWSIEQIANIIKDFISKSDPDTIKDWNISPVKANPSKHEKFWFSVWAQKKGRVHESITDSCTLFYFH